MLKTEAEDAKKLVKRSSYSTQSERESAGTSRGHSGSYKNRLGELVLKLTGPAKAILNSELTDIFPEQHI